MTDAQASPEGASEDRDEVSLLAVGSVLLRWRRTVVSLVVAGGFLGIALGLVRSRAYVSAATFIPQGSDASTVSGLALAASQFGIRLPSSASGTWGPPVYVDLLRSQVLLEPIALDTVVVVEEGGRRAAVADLLRVGARRPARRTELAVRELARAVDAAEVRRLGAVRVSVSTRWPSVSLALSERLVRGVIAFNLDTRKSQAAAERQFVEGLAGEAERALREAEDRLQRFLQRNRAIADSPELEFENGRLEREVALRQQVYTSLLQSREEARIREVRDTPVITVLEAPRLPVVGESRRLVSKGVLGGLAGVVLGLLVAFLGEELAGARRESSGEALEFFELVEEATPRFLRRGGRWRRFLRRDVGTAPRQV